MVSAAVGGASLVLAARTAADRHMYRRSRRSGEGLFCTSDVKGFGRAWLGRRLRAIAGGSRFCRTWGDCYGYLLIATGRAELMVDPRMHVWDCAALQPVMEEAGGTFTDWAGNAHDLGAEGVATTGLYSRKRCRSFAGDQRSLQKAGARTASPG